jgi:hypothetical protein
MTFAKLRGSSRKDDVAALAGFDSIILRASTEYEYSKECSHGA